VASRAFYRASIRRVSRIDHALWTFLLIAGCVPTDDGKPAPEGTTTAATPPQPVAVDAARLPRLGNLPRTLPSRQPPAAPDGPRGIAGRLQPGTVAQPAAPGAAPSPGAPPPVGPGAAPVPGAPPPVAPGAAQPASEGPPDAPIKTVFYDFFERAELGPTWNATSGVWRIDAGKLCGQGARNHPVWLRRKLPTNARIEFDAMSTSPDGDLKVEVWGDGKSFAKGTSYSDATSYIAIFGGWKNEYHVLARIDEHAKDRTELRTDPSGTNPKTARVMPNRWYHFKVERSDGKTVRWLVDDIEILSLTDPKPLKGDGHAHLGFNDWDVRVCFDNLKITPLGD
jgi:hypothetical protein